MASKSDSTAPLFRHREQLQPHESLARVPEMPPKEYTAFRADIEARGIQVPLEITADGTLLDGRHRLRAPASSESSSCRCGSSRQTIPPSTSCSPRCNAAT